MHNTNSGTVHGSLVQAASIDTVNITNLPPPPTALNGLPPVSGTFTGRLPELEELRAGRGLTLVHGLGGIGKTQLLLHYAHREKARFPGRSLNLNLHGYDARLHVEPTQALRSFLRALGTREEDIPPEESERSALFRSAMAEREDMLVLLDNASSAKQVKPLLVDRHRVLVSSRHRLTDLGGTRIPLGVLPLEEAVELVGDPELAELCGRLPLALKIMAAHIDLESATDWAAELRAEGLPLLDDGDTRQVAATFALSYRWLSPDQRRMFRLLSLHPGDEVVADTAAALSGLPSGKAKMLLRDLHRASLLEGGTRFHDLVRQYAALCLQEEPETERTAAEDRMIAHYRTTAAEHAKGIEIHRCTPEAVGWMDRHHRSVLEVATTAHERGLAEQVVGIADAMFRYFSLRKHMADWFTLQEMAVDSAARLVDRKSLAKVYNRLATIHRQQRRFAEAIRFCERSLAIQEEMDDPIGIGSALIVLAATYREMDRPDLALPCCERSLAIRRLVHDPRGLGISLSNVGLTHLDLGDADLAMEYFTEALELQRSTGQEGGVAITQHGIGRAHQACGRLDQAFEHYGASLRIQRHRDDRFGTAITLRSLGGAYAEAGRTAEAVETYQESLVLFEGSRDDHRADEVRDLISALTP
ncbi:tetratricopeptide repeat protein [Umezawaea sp. Da 62-37]|uniref:ATP-binding protein n=1 Tax=Umezawaea sp. Da 62-37 TaxID=3075927 RepID=UPI0028F73842|nr:tetratricopeptide repeat protein [Umezawaea sp. Da 62-37]WNV88806.1 tetratricopeptide repeat protein [Umezawaea sp. Da 62-37]